MALKLKILLVILVSIIVLLCAGAFSFYRALNEPNSFSNESVIVEVKNGSVNKVGESLKSKGILRMPLLFSIYSRISQQNIYTGYYKLPKNLSAKEIFEALANDKYRVYKVTIPEGYRTEQIAQKLANDELSDYSDFIEAAKGKEGYLFPDTYFFAKNIDPKEIVKTLNDNFIEKTKNLELKKEDLVLASIVERETAGDDRSIIAGIYKNRINIQMKLDADPTVQYAKDSNTIENLSGEKLLNFKFWRSITSKEYYSTISDYNTYINNTLPPGPICNPGIKSIQAALNPDENDYIYFFHKDGELYPSRTIEEHNAKKREYLY